MESQYANTLLFKVKDSLFSRNPLNMSIENWHNRVVCRKQAKRSPSIIWRSFHFSFPCQIGCNMRDWSWKLFACSTNRGILSYPSKIDFAERFADFLQNLGLFLQLFGGELVSLCSLFSFFFGGLVLLHSVSDPPQVELLESWLCLCIRLIL